MIPSRSCTKTWGIASGAPRWFESPAHPLAYPLAHSTARPSARPPALVLVEAGHDVEHLAQAEKLERLRHRTGGADDRDMPLGTLAGVHEHVDAGRVHKRGPGQSAPKQPRLRAQQPVETR